VIGPVGVGVEVGNVVDEVGKVVRVVDDAGMCISVHGYISFHTVHMEFESLQKRKKNIIASRQHLNAQLLNYNLPIS
jgi:hypothetical protein